MRSQINKILKLLKNHVNQNNLEIQYNQDEIRRIMNTSDLKDKENASLQDKSLINEELFMENEDFLHMQLQLNEFFEKYGHFFSEDDKNMPEQEDEAPMPYFKKTVEGELIYEPGHPQFSNNRFFNRLLKYYQENENYEMCDRLIKIKRTSNKF